MEEESSKEESSFNFQNSDYKYEDIIEIQGKKIQSRRLFIIGQEEDQVEKCVQQLEKIGQIIKIEREKNKAIIYYTKPIYISIAKKAIKGLQKIKVFKSKTKISHSLFSSSDYNSENSSSNNSNNMSFLSEEIMLNNNIECKKKICSDLIDLIFTHKWNIIDLLDYIQSSENRTSMQEVLLQEREKIESALEIATKYKVAKQQVQQNERISLETSKSSSLQKEQKVNNLENQKEELFTSQSYQLFSFIGQNQQENNNILEESSLNKQLLQIEDNDQIYKESLNNNSIQTSKNQKAAIEYEQKYYDRQAKGQLKRLQQKDSSPFNQILSQKRQKSSRSQTPTKQ